MQTNTEIVICKCTSNPNTLCKTQTDEQHWSIKQNKMMQYLAFEVFLSFDISFVREAFFLFQHKHKHTTRNRYRYLRGFVFHCLHKHSNTNRKTITNNKQSIQKPPCYTHTNRTTSRCSKDKQIKIETEKKNMNTKTVYFQQKCVQLVHIQTNSPSNSRIKQGRQNRGLSGSRLFCSSSRTKWTHSFNQPWSRFSV